MNPALTKLEAQVLKSARTYLEEKGYTEVTTPRLVRASGACENINTLFEISVDGDYKWFGKTRRAYLAQTGQLYLEALVPSLKRVYCVGPSFRAEPDVDSRHLTEFQMIEIEFSGGFEELLGEIEGVIKRMVSDLKSFPGKILSGLGLSPEKMKNLKCPGDRFPRLTYNEAIARLKRSGVKVDWGDDIKRAHEALLVKQTGYQPLFITHYPNPMWDHGREIEVEKFFNMLPDPENPHLVQSCDLILPKGGEAVGAAARVWQTDILVKRLRNSRMFQRLKSRGGSLKDFSWYLNQVRTNGSLPHAGCGFGVARILQWILGRSDIRESVTFPANRKTLI